MSFIYEERKHRVTQVVPKLDSYSCIKCRLFTRKENTVTQVVPKLDSYSCIKCRLYTRKENTESHKKFPNLTPTAASNVVYIRRKKTQSQNVNLMIQNVSQKWQSDPDGRNKIVLNRILSSQVSCSRSIFEREMRKRERQRQRQKDRETERGRKLRHFTSFIVFL